VIALLFLLPFLDNKPERDPRARPRVSAVVTLIVVAVSTLTWLGFRDTPVEKDPSIWSPRAVAGLDLTTSDKCTRCHTAGGAGPDLTRGRIARDDLWIAGHLSDPDMIAPGLRPPPADAPKLQEARAVVAWAEKVREGAPAPHVDADIRAGMDVFGTRCITCHVIDGDGGKEGPDLSHEGRKHDAAWLARWIANPSAINPDSDMPAFAGKLSPDELTAVAKYLEQRQ
jgi:mono/diheme cytochrome c family protein